jgi:glycosyltransferase involved in cell wall biosynthesis
VAEDENKQQSQKKHHRRRYNNRRPASTQTQDSRELETNDLQSNRLQNSAQQTPKKENSPRQEHTQSSIGSPPVQQHTQPQRPKNSDNRHHSHSTINISVVIPLLNEEESLPELTIRLKEILSVSARDKYEVIFIDDGSTDNSFQVLRQIHQKDNRFKAIRFRRNYGKSAALAVGFAEAKGDIVITMDADLQDDPKEIPHLIAKLNEGYDLVSGWKKKRHDPFHKTIPSRFFNFVTSTVSGIKLHDFNCGLKAYRKEVVKTLQVYGEMHRYLPALANWDGFRVTEIPVTHHARKFGKSKFGFSRFLKGFLDLLTVLFTTRYVKRPLHLFGTVGTLLALIGFGTDLYLTIEWSLGKTSLSNRPLALFGVALIIVGVQLISFGLIGELLVKNFQKNVEYSVRERL